MERWFQPTVFLPVSFVIVFDTAVKLHVEAAYVASLEKEIEALRHSLDQHYTLASLSSSSNEIITPRAPGNSIVHNQFPLQNIEQLVDIQVELARQSDLAAYITGASISSVKPLWLD